MKFKLSAYSFNFLLLVIWAISSLTGKAQSDTVSQYPPLGKLVDIGGWKLHVIQQGSDKSSASVILEAGVGDFSFDWSLVQSKVAKFARVYSYDRAGYAWSDMGPNRIQCTRMYIIFIPY